MKRRKSSLKKSNCCNGNFHTSRRTGPSIEANSADYKGCLNFRRFILGVLFFWSGCVAIAKPPVTIPERPIQYSGLITKSVVNRDGKNVGILDTYRFDIQMFQKAYQMTCISLSGVCCFDEVAGCDGEDVYLLRKQWPSWEDKEKNSQYQEYAIVTAGAFPTMGDPEAQLLWILLASKRQITNGQSLALSHITYAPYDGLKADVHYRGDWPELITVYSPGVTQVSGETVPLPTPFEKGYKLWDFTIGSFETQGAIIYPLDAQFSQYTIFYNAESQKGEHRLIRRIGISVTNVAYMSAPLADYRPAIAKKDIIAVDYRYSQDVPRPGKGVVDAIQYPLLNGKWLDRKDKKVVVAGIAIKSEIQYSKNLPFGSKKRHLIWIILCVTSALPVGFVLRFWLKKSKSVKQKS